jgi:hypothetical protein
MVIFSKRVVASLTLVVSCISGAEAFAPITHVGRIDSPTAQQPFITALNVANVPKDDGSGLSYAERSRPFRRDVFSYDLWVKHRSTDRFVGNLFDVLKSGVVRQLLGEVFLVTSVAVFICAYNSLFVDGYDDFTGAHHAAIYTSQFLPILKMPADFFTLSSPALSLLLGKFYRQD